MSKIAEVYKFTYTGTEYHYTSHDTAFKYQGVTCTPHNLKRGKITQTQDVAKSNLEFTAQLDFEISDMHRSGATVQRIKVDVIRVNPDTADGDPDYTGDVMFSGFIANVTWKNTHVKIKCDHVIAMLGSNILRYQYSPICNHSQYDASCGLSFPIFAESTTITEVQDAGYTIIITPLDAQHFVNSAGSLCKVNGEQGTISEMSSATTIKLFRPIPNAAPGDTIEIAPSCQQNWLFCRDYFNNLHNCTAFIDVPDHNPFGPEGLKS